MIMQTRLHSDGRTVQTTSKELYISFVKKKSTWSEGADFGREELEEGLDEWMVSS